MIGVDPGHGLDDSLRVAALRPQNLGAGREALLARGQARPACLDDNEGGVEGFGARPGGIGLGARLLILGR